MYISNTLKLIDFENSLKYQWAAKSFFKNNHKVSSLKVQQYLLNVYEHITL